MAIRWSCCSNNSSRVFPTTVWYLVLPLFGLGLSFPVSGSNFPGAWKSTCEVSAAASPFPLVVRRCNSRGPFFFFSALKTSTKPVKSCPSMGPEYAIFSASNRFAAAGCSWVERSKKALSAPTLGSIPMVLSFKIMSTLAWVVPRWFKASNAIPLAIDASPITAICKASSPFWAAASAIPKIAEREVEECPVPKASNALSSRLGKPLIPPHCRKAEKAARRPVSILCP